MYRIGEEDKGTTKTRKSRRIPMNNTLKEILWEAAAQRRMGLLHPEFIIESRQGKRSEHAITQYVSKVNRSVGITGIGVTAIRRTVASWMERLTANRNAIASLLGHTEIIDTQHYQYEVSNREEKKKLLNG